MKITKQRLKEIIKEELSEMDLPKWEGEPFGEYDLEAENEKGRAKQAWDLTKNTHADVLVQAAIAAIGDHYTTVAVRKLVFDLVKGLDDEGFKKFEAALAKAVSPTGEGF